jgi:5-methylcytosine-specific restriction endonuclease McrA
MIFIDNKYTRIYNTIIVRAKSRNLGHSTYTENHHIIPRSLGGADTSDNLVRLSAREHYICHRLLPKMLEGEARYKMLCAIVRMAHSNQPQRLKISSKVYEHAKVERSQLHSQLFSGENNPFYGQKHSEETKQRLREARAQQVELQGGTMTQEARVKLSQAAKGRKLSDQHKQKIGIANQGKTRSEEYRAAVSKRMSGHVKSQETLDKLRSKASKEPKPQITCPYCGSTGGEPSMKRWHFDRCKSK